MTIPILETPRLLLRPLAPTDLDALAEILGDPVGMAFYPHAFGRAETLAWIERDLARYETLGFGHLAMEMRSDGQFVGDCGPTILRVAGVDEIELGWHVRRDDWNQGLATEAALTIRDWAFDGLGLRRLISLVRPENQASSRVAEKIGMTIEREVEYNGLRHLVWSMAADTRGSAALGRATLNRRPLEERRTRWTPRCPRSATTSIPRYAPGCVSKGWPRSSPAR